MIIKLFTIICLTFSPLYANVESKTIYGRWNIQIYDGRVELFNLEKKRCYLKVSEDGKTMTFSSIYKGGYSMSVQLVEEENESNN